MTQKNIFFIIKINIFWGDLSGISAKTATLVSTSLKLNTCFLDTLILSMRFCIPTIHMFWSDLTMHRLHCIHCVRKAGLSSATLYSLPLEMARSSSAALFSLLSEGWVVIGYTTLTTLRNGSFVIGWFFFTAFRRLGCYRLHCNHCQQKARLTSAILYSLPLEMAHLSLSEHL